MERLTDLGSDRSGLAAPNPCAYVRQADLAPLMRRPTCRSTGVTDEPCTSAVFRYSNVKYLPEECPPHQENSHG